KPAAGVQVVDSMLAIKQIRPQLFICLLHFSAVVDIKWASISVLTKCLQLDFRKTKRPAHFCLLVVKVLRKKSLMTLAATIQSYCSTYACCGFMQPSETRFV